MARRTTLGFCRLLAACLIMASLIMVGALVTIEHAAAQVPRQPIAALATADSTTTRIVGGHVTTGGTLDFGDQPRRPPRRQSAEQAADPTWLYDFVERLIAGTPDQHQRPARPITAKRPPGTKAPALAKAAPAQPPIIQTALPIIPVAPAAPGNVVTGAIDRTQPAPSALPDMNRGDLDAGIVGDAEISQAREDLIKLELARRTYDETRLSGASAFDTRHDWRVLERGRDAWSATELAAAIAAGFEANTYINDTTKTIVVAIAGTQDLRRDFIEADIWRALIQAEAPQHFFLAKSYVRSVQARYQAAGYHTECVGHSLGGGACAYAGSELAIRAVVVNPISAGRLNELARNFVTNYVVDGDIAAAIYQLRGNELSGDIQTIRHNRELVREELRRRYGVLAGPIRVVRDLRNSVKVHQIDRALDIIAAYAATSRVK